MPGVITPFLENIDALVSHFGLVLDRSSHRFIKVGRLYVEKSFVQIKPFPATDLSKQNDI
jgi:hypothetical protein